MKPFPKICLFVCTIALCMLIAITKCFSQEEYQQKVLRKNHIGRMYNFDLSNKKDGYYKISIRLLGVINMAKHQQLKVLRRQTVWGPNRHNTGRVYFYDRNNKPLGLYELGGMYDLPCKIEHGKLIFIKTAYDDCNLNERTEIDLTHGIPKEIFIKCRGNTGDIYPFVAD